MIDRSESTLGRRALLGAAAAGVGLWMTRGLGARGLGLTAEATSYEQTLRAIGRSLTAKQRELAVFPTDHPSR